MGAFASHSSTLIVFRAGPTAGGRRGWDGREDAMHTVVGTSDKLIYGYTGQKSSSSDRADYALNNHHCVGQFQ
jgi:hypothetical protein